MAAGHLQFEIANINVFHTPTPYAFGTVRLNRDDVLPDGSGVAHNLSVKVRINTSADATVEALKQALLEKAVEQIRLALADLEGKSALELSSDAQKAFDQELEPFQEV
jgi:hypothetical protein